MPSPTSARRIWLRRQLALACLAASAPALSWATIDLNHANQAELEMVQGIGPQLSERILAERARGRFTDWADFVARMKGIGPSHAKRLSDAGLRVQGLAFDAAPQAPAASR
ncbi:MAG: helix-hairpin-helix domain-containing protein [Burkholderiales bacterium]|nr:helix-hairpin-helix domain-containing protein [Burkholderiales bacterium]